MKTLLIVLVAVVGFCYFGENKCPKVLKDNKEMLLGVLVGLALCSFMGLKIEGFPCNDKTDCAMGEICKTGRGGKYCGPSPASCRFDNQCGNGMMCQSGRCLPARDRAQSRVTTSCYHDSQCESPQVCIHSSTSMRDLGYCGPQSSQRTPCDNDTDCPSGWSCKAGLGENMCHRPRGGK